MPIYEYRRPDGTTFDVLQKFSDDALTHDPDTGVPVQKVLSAPAIHFKGAGFHNTDYGTKKRPVGGGDSSAGDSSSSASSDSGSSDTGSSSDASGGSSDAPASSSTSSSGSSGGSSSSSASASSSSGGSSSASAD